jgi:hypothetical protein
MKSLLSTGVIVAALLAGPSIGWASNTYDSGNGWAIFKESDGCSLVIPYEGDVELYLSYSSSYTSSFLAIMNPAYKSVKKDQEYKVDLVLYEGDRTDEGWGEVKMHGLTVGGQPAIGAWLNSAQIMSDLQENTGLLLTRNKGEIVVEDLNIKGVKARLAKLKQCGDDVQRENPIDPFAE